MRKFCAKHFCFCWKQLKNLLINYFRQKRKGGNDGGRVTCIITVAKFYSSTIPLPRLASPLVLQNETPSPNRRVVLFGVGWPADWMDDLMERQFGSAGIWWHIEHENLIGLAVSGDDGRVCLSYAAERCYFDFSLAVLFNGNRRRRIVLFVFLFADRDRPLRKRVLLVPLPMVMWFGGRRNFRGERKGERGDYEKRARRHSRLAAGEKIGDTRRRRQDSRLSAVANQAKCNANLYSPFTKQVGNKTAECRHEKSSCFYRKENQKPFKHLYRAKKQIFHCWSLLCWRGKTDFSTLAFYNSAIKLWTTIFYK